MKLGDFFCKNEGKGNSAAAVFLLAGMIIIAFSMLWDKDIKKSEKGSFSDDLTCYSEMLETNLKEAVEGVVGGDAKVMITFESTFENVYYSDAVINEAITADKTDRKSEKQLVLTGNMGNDQSPVVVKMLSPKPSGAVIVCVGGNSQEFKARVSELAACALGISKNKIYVTGGN